MKKPETYFDMFLRIAPLLWLACLLLACSSSTLIRSNGTKHLKLGDAMPDSSKQTFKGHTMRDTVFKGEGYEWNASVIDYPRGAVILEQDFFGNDFINRIRIESADFSYKKKIRVGSKLADLKAVSPEWSLTHLKEYNRIDIYTDGIHFLISDEKLPEAVKNKARLLPEDLDLEAKILTIVLM